MEEKLGQGHLQRPEFPPLTPNAGKERVLIFFPCSSHASCGKPGTLGQDSFWPPTPTKCLTVNVECGSLTLVLTSCQSLTSSQCKSPSKLPYFFPKLKISIYFSQ